MKKFILTSVVLFVSLITFAQDWANNKNLYESENTVRPGNSQNLMFDVRPKYRNPVKMEKIQGADFLHDFIADYPSNWIYEYVSTDISANINGIAMNGVGANDELTLEQKRILNTVGLGNDITISVRYKTKNAATDHLDNRTMKLKMTVVPESDAGYVGGYQQLKKYLREHIINKLTPTTPDEFQGKVIFTINEAGEISNAKITMSSGDPEIDKLLIKKINEMPKWRPALNSIGVKVKQEFEFTVGNMDGC